ncbi:glycosyltransferase family 2 protein, partial [Hydrogenophaga sp.]|uniref:glycosyltransferase family 2 protein n=1 Tax=Hydrogenophaga sp. TaxID=1904254 RepID=UPI00261E6A7C
HVVIDGASTDTTLALIRAHGRQPQVLVSEPDRGLYDAMNKGLRLATGDYVAFLNADDVYARTDAVASMVHACAAHDADAAWADLVYVRPDDLDAVVRYWKAEPFRPGLLEQGWMPPHPTLFVRRSLLQQLGGFDLRYRFHADFDLVVRMLSRPGLRTHHVPGILVRMRAGGHTNRSWRNVVRGNLESMRILRTHKLRGGGTMLLHKLRHRGLQFLRRPADMG